MQVLREGDPYCSNLNTMTGRARVSKLKGSDGAVVDYVSAISTGANDPLQKVQMHVYPYFVGLEWRGFQRNWKYLLQSLEEQTLNCLHAGNVVAM